MSKKEKNSKKKQNSKKKSEPKQYVIGASATKKFLIVFVSIFVGIAVVLGTVAGVASAIKNSSYIFYSEGVGVDEGLLNYFTAYYKNQYFQNNSIPGTNDTEEFWTTAPYAPATNTTNEQFFKVSLEELIKKLIASNVIFDEMFTLSSSDRKEIKIAMQNVFERLQVKNKSEFNEKVKDFGFDYRDFKLASEMIYKDYVWSNYAFGENGSNMDSYIEYCNEFYGSYYSRVKFIFIRTEDTFKTDGEGNRVLENGADVTVELTESEKAERQEYIAEIKACVDGINEGTVDISGFDKYASDIMKKYAEIDEEAVNGYYLYKDDELKVISTFTASLSEDIPNAAEAALSLEMGKGAYAELNEEEDGFAGYLFVLRDTLEDYAYYDTSDDGFFGDFLVLAKNWLTNKLINEYDDFEARETYASYSIINIPYMKSTKDYLITLNP